MAKGIEIGVASETKAFKQGVEVGIIAPVEDAIEALDQLGRNKGPEKLEGALEDAQTASQRLKKETERTADNIDTEYRRAYKGMADDADTGFRKSGEASKTFKEEALANFSEVASTFDGSLEGISDGIQGTFGGAALAIGGGVGLALGAIGAVGGAALNAAVSTAEEVKETVSDAFADMVENSARFVSATFINQELESLLADDGKSAQIEKWADKFGIAAGDIALAMAGDETAAAKVNHELGRFIDRVTAGASTQGDARTIMQEYALDVDGLTGSIDSQNSAIETAQGRYDTFASAQDTLASRAGAATTAVEGVGAAVENLPKDATTTLTVDTSGADAAVRNWTGVPRSVRITADLFTRSGQKVI